LFLLEERSVVSDQELSEFQAAMERLRKENTSTPEKARKFLKEEGFLDENGEIAEQYASAVAGR
jgi:hypothetical protein